MKNGAIEKLKNYVEVHNKDLAVVCGCITDDGIVTVMAGSKGSVEEHKSTGRPIIDAIYFVSDDRVKKAIEMPQTASFMKAFISAMDKRGVTF